MNVMQTCYDSEPTDIQTHLVSIKGSYDPLSPDQLDGTVLTFGLGEHFTAEGTANSMTGRYVLVEKRVFGRVQIMFTGISSRLLLPGFRLYIKSQ